MQRWRDYLGEKKGKRNSLLFYCQLHLLSRDGNIHALFNKLLWSEKFSNKSRQQKLEGEKACFGTIAAEGGTSTYQTRILFLKIDKDKILKIIWMILKGRDFGQNIQLLLLWHQPCQNVIGQKLDRET